MDAESITKAVRERVEDVLDDAARFEIPQDAAVGHEDGVTYVAVRYRQPFDASRRYELYVRMSAIESDVREKTGENVSLVPSPPFSPGGTGRLRHAA